MKHRKDADPFTFLKLNTPDLKRDQLSTEQVFEEMEKDRAHRQSKVSKVTTPEQTIKTKVSIKMKPEEERSKAYTFTLRLMEYEMLKQIKNDNLIRSMSATVGHLIVQETARRGKMQQEQDIKNTPKRPVGRPSKGMQTPAGKYDAWILNVDDLPEDIGKALLAVSDEVKEVLIGLPLDERLKWITASVDMYQEHGDDLTAFLTEQALDYKNDKYVNKENK